MEKIIITVVLLIIAAVFKAFMDLSSENKFERTWLNKEAWIFKWKHEKRKQSHDQISHVLVGWKTKHWWYLGLKETAYPERFPFSSTILVFLTDGWHLFQFFFLSCIELAIAIQFDHWVFWFFMFKIILSGSFEFTYSIIKKRLNK
jgi:hypothetical protein